jgi:hypothetical protein
MAMEVRDGGVWAFTISEEEVNGAKEWSMTALQARGPRRTSRKSHRFPEPKAGFLKYNATIIHWITYTVDLGSSYSLVHTSGFYISIAEALVEGYKMLESSKRGELNHLAYVD